MSTERNVIEWARDILDIVNGRVLSSSGEYQQARNHQDMAQAVIDMAEALEFYADGEHLPGLVQTPAGEYWSDKQDTGEMARTVLRKHGVVK